MTPSPASPALENNYEERDNFGNNFNLFLGDDLVEQVGELAREQ